MDLQKAYDIVESSALETILKELSFPNRLINWIMIIVTIVSYKFRINGEHYRIMEAKRGLRQGDPLSPLLFFIIMEYLHRVLQKLKHIPDYNFHSKCEKLSIISTSFVDYYFLLEVIPNSYLWLWKLLRVFPNPIGYLSIQTNSSSIVAMLTTRQSRKFNSLQTSLKVPFPLSTLASL